MQKMYSHIIFKTNYQSCSGVHSSLSRKHSGHHCHKIHASDICSNTEPHRIPLPTNLHYTHTRHPYTGHVCIEFHRLLKVVEASKALDNTLKIFSRVRGFGRKIWE